VEIKLARHCSKYEVCMKGSETIFSIHSVVGLSTYQRLFCIHYLPLISHKPHSVALLRCDLWVALMTMKRIWWWK